MPPRAHQSPQPPSATITSRIRRTHHVRAKCVTENEKKTKQKKKKMRTNFVSSHLSHLQVSTHLAIRHTHTHKRRSATHPHIQTTQCGRRRSGNAVLSFRMTWLCVIFITRFERLLELHIEMRENIFGQRARETRRRAVGARTNAEDRRTSRERERERARPYCTQFSSSMFMLFSFTVYFSWAFLYAAHRVLVLSAAVYFWSAHFSFSFSVVFLHTHKHNPIFCRSFFISVIQCLSLTLFFIFPFRHGCTASVALPIRICILFYFFAVFFFIFSCGNIEANNYNEKVSIIFFFVVRSVRVRWERHE